MCRQLVLARDLLGVGLLTEFDQKVRVFFQSIVEVTFLQHQDIFFLRDLSSGGQSQCTQEEKLQHCFCRAFVLDRKMETADTVGEGLSCKTVSVLVFSLFKVGRVAGILCLPLLTWHRTQKPEGSALVRMRIYQAESSSC